MGIDVLSNARSVGPSLSERSEIIETQRRLPEDVVSDLRSAGLFRLFVPKSLGGPEVDVETAVTTISEIARHDGGSGWCVMIAATTSLLAGFLPEEHAQVIYGPNNACTGGFAAPVGKATIVDGGLLITGTWEWGSGTQHCTWVGGGTRLFGKDGKPFKREDGLFAPFVYMDPNDIEFLDNWHVTGLAGSGSTDYCASEAFVPEGRWVQLTDANPRLDGPQWRFPFYGILAAGVAAVAIGLLDGAVSRFKEIAIAKNPQGSSRTLAERASGQTILSIAEATVRSSRAFLLDALGTAWDTAIKGDSLTIEDRRSIRLASCDAAQRCSNALVNLGREAGGTAVYLREPLQRFVRDGQVASTHAMVAQRIYELTGRLALDLETDTTLL